MPQGNLVLSKLKIRYDDLEFGFNTTSASGGLAVCYIDPDHGSVDCDGGSDSTDLQIPADFDPSRVLVIPGWSEVDGGSELAFDFARQYLPEHHGNVRAVCSRKGAYSRFEPFLDSTGCLNRWHAYEEQRKRAPVINWCEENCVEVVLQ